MPAGIDVTPADVYSLARTFATAQDQVCTGIIPTLAAALHANAGMAGDDGGARQFAARYDPAAAAALTALCAAVASLGSLGNGIAVTANNFVAADHASTNGAAGVPATYPAVTDVTGTSVSPPPSSIGPGSDPLPGPLAKYWPDGHQDKLRATASAWDAARVALEDTVGPLQLGVNAVMENNSSASLTAMAAFLGDLWGADGTSGILGVIHQACGALRDACDNYAGAIDKTHSDLENALAGAGIAIGVTTIIGGIVGFFTGGAGDAAAGWADSAEAAAILGPIADEFDVAVSAELDAAIDTELVPLLQAAADGAPEVESVTADVTQVENVLEEEMAGTRAGGGGGGGGGPPTGGGGGGGEPPTGGSEPPAGGSDGPSEPTPGNGSLRITGQKASPEEINAAQKVADRGYNVVLRDPPPDGGTAGVNTSDLLVNGEQWDIYSPRSGSINGIVREIAKKGRQVRGGGVVLNLENSPLNPGDINLPNLLARVRGVTSNISNIIIVK